MKKTRYAVWGLYGIALLVILNTNLQAQTIARKPVNTSPFSSSIKYTEGKPLSIGDRVPDLVFTELINSDKKSIRLSDYKNRVIILDFWATWCSACIKNFPKMDSLQGKFKDQLQILLVNTLHTNDTKEKVNAFLDKWKKRHDNLSLPIVLKDSITEVLFPHKEIPHYIWIKDGVVTAVTDALEVNADNISGIIAGKGAKLKEKKDNMDFDWQKPLFINGNGGSGENIKYRSLLTNFIEGLPGMTGIMREENGLVTKIFAYNASLFTLYKHALPEAMEFKYNRTIFDVRDPSKIAKRGEWGNWKYENTWVYELIVPPTTLETIRKKMMNDLVNYFGIKACIEQRKVKSLVLVQTRADVKFDLPIGEADNSLYENDDMPKSIRNLPITMLVNRLNDLYSIPVIDESNLKANVNMVLPADLKNLESLKLALNKYGFDLVEKERMLEMFVFTETYK